MSKHLRGRLLFLSLVCSFPLISSSPLNLETNFFEEGPSNYTKLLKEIKQLDLTAITNQLLEIAEGGFRSKQILKDTLLLHRRLQRKQPLDLVLIDKSLEEIAELKIVLELEEARLRELNLEKKRQQERLFNLVFNLLELIKGHQELTTLLEEIKTSELVYDLTEINLLGATTRGVG